MAHHRAQTRRHYAGIQMHAAGGLHEYVEALVRRALEPGSRILDVGAGSGALTARLSAAGYVMTATELEPEDYQADAAIVEWDASAANLPLPGSSFDAICAVEVLEHVENPMQALRNFHALLRAGGLLVATTPNIGHPRSRLKFFLTGAPSYFGTREYDAGGHRTLLPDWLLRRHIEEAGYVVLSVSYAGRMSLPPKSRWLWRLVSPFVFRLHSSPRHDEGCITVVEARKPRRSAASAGPRGDQPADYD